jgi:hypothetical protein
MSSRARLLPVPSFVRRIQMRHQFASISNTPPAAASVAKAPVEVLKVIFLRIVPLPVNCAAIRMTGVATASLRTYRLATQSVESSGIA